MLYKLHISNQSYDFKAVTIVFRTSFPQATSSRKFLDRITFCFKVTLIFYIHGGLPRGRCDKSSRAEFQNSMCDIDLFFQQNGFQSSLVGQLASDLNFLPYFLKKHIVRIRQNLVWSFVIDCFMGARDGF